MLATREAVPLLANNPIILGRLIQPFKHLALRNPSIISYSIDRAKMVQQFWRRSLARCIRVVQACYLVQFSAFVRPQTLNVRIMYDLMPIVRSRP